MWVLYNREGFGKILSNRQDYYGVEMKYSQINPSVLLRGVIK